VIFVVFLTLGMELVKASSTTRQHACCFWGLCSDFPPSQIAKEFVGWMKSGPKDIGTATFETLRICENCMNYWDGGLSFWRQRPEHAAYDFSTVK
jgi:hypothetical protein